LASLTSAENRGGCATERALQRGFAIVIRTAKEMAEKIETTGDPARSYLTQSRKGIDRKLYLKDLAELLPEAGDGNGLQFTVLLAQPRCVSPHVRASHPQCPAIGRELCRSRSVRLR
jgi:hypothetical protein